MFDAYATVTTVHILLLVNRTCNIVGVSLCSHGTNSSNIDSQN